MKKIFFAALFLVSMFGFISVITAKADSEPDQTILDDALKAVRAAPAQLTDQERNQLVCRGKLHACFQASKFELDDFLESIRLAQFPISQCQNACASVNTNACPNSACVERCVVAAGAASGECS
jgi:hypothetical protein